MPNLDIYYENQKGDNNQNVDSIDVIDEQELLTLTFILPEEKRNNLLPLY